MNNLIAKALIVDDEFEACENLRSFLEELAPGLEIMACVHSTKEAEEYIQKENPDIVFLDIEMPDETGIEFLKRIDTSSFETVFVTAYNEYAIKAFKLNAIDYVLKPINKEYLKKKLNRAQEFLQARNNRSVTSTQLLTAPGPKEQNHLVLRSGAEIHYVNFDNIVYLSSDGNYSNFFTAKDQQHYVGSYNLKHYEDILPTEFARVHRGYIINETLIKHV